MTEQAMIHGGESADARVALEKFIHHHTSPLGEGLVVKGFMSAVKLDAENAIVRG